MEGERSRRSSVRVTRQKQKRCAGETRVRRVRGGNKSEGRFSCDPRLLFQRWRFVCTKDDTCSVSRARANTWKDIGCVLITSHESSTDNDSVNGESVQSCRSNRRQTRRWNRGCRRMREGEGGRWERESLGERLLSLTRGEGKMTGRMLINQPRVLFGLWHEAAPSLSPQKMFTLREDALIELKRRVE